MASIRNSHKFVNENDSKATRMDLASAGVTGNWRPDEIAHITRYEKIVDLLLSESKRLGRPVDTLEVGMGECWPLRILYKAFVVKKSDVVRSYHGFDIDPACAIDHKWWSNGGKDIHTSSWFQNFNGKAHIQDLTTNPELDVPDDSVDVAWTTEVIEHMKEEFVEPWVASMARKVRSGGMAYVSTPNHNGSNDKLPEDHVKEWTDVELRALLEKYFTIECVTGTFIQMRHFERAQAEYEAGKRSVGWDPDMVEMIKNRYGRHFQRVILAMPYPDVANNCNWILRKK